MKVVINKCFGGFGLSQKATKRLAELQGRPCYFFKHTPGDYSSYVPAGKDGGVFISAFDVPNPNDKQGLSEGKFYKQHHISDVPEDRTNPLLIQVVEELGEKANGGFASLKIVEIPDGTEYTIEEYDGIEHVTEAHETWS